MRLRQLCGEHRTADAVAYYDSLDSMPRTALDDLVTRWLALNYLGRTVEATELSVGLFGARVADYDFDALAADPEVVNAVGLSRRMLVAVAINNASPLEQARRLRLHMERAP